MNPECTHLNATDADAALLCDRLHEAGIPIRDGVETINFIASSPREEVIANTVNGVHEANEVYATWIDAIESEEESTVKTSSYDESSFPLATYAAQNTSFRVPWSLALNKAILIKVALKIAAIKASLQEEGLSQGSADYNLKLAQQLKDYVLNAGELGVENRLSQTWTAAEAIEHREAGCVEYAMIYYELCRLAGLNARMVQVTINNYGHAVVHFCVALYLDAANTPTLVDLTQPTPFLIRPHEEWVTVPEVSMATYYNINLGLFPPATYPADPDPQRFAFAENQFRIAQRLDPNLPLLHYNMYRLYDTYGYADLATSSLQRTIELDPDFLEANSELINQQ